MPADKFGYPFFHPSKKGGYFYEMSNNPKNDEPLEGLDQDFSVSGAVITMLCNGPTSFSVGKNGRGFNGSIGGCNMDFKATAKRGYAYKPDDVRDLEFKCLIKLNNIQAGFSMSCCTGKHSSTGCCQSFTYMGNIEDASANPPTFRFRKETTHPNYENSPEGIWTHPKAPDPLNGSGKYFGFGFCRYNIPTPGGTSPQDDNVGLEIWFNPNPETDKQNWTMLKRTIDKKGNGWTSNPNDCNGDKDQIGVWSNAHNRLKSNSTSGTINFKQITFREIDPTGDFDEPGTGGEPPGGGGDGGGPPPPGGGGNPSENPPTVSTVQSTFTLKRDINVYTSITCAGSEEGGGAGGTARVYSVPSDSGNARELSNSSGHGFRTRIAQKVAKSNSPIVDQVIKQADIYLKKTGSPTTPDIQFKIWDDTGVVAYTSTTDIDPASLTTSFVKYSFDCSSNTHMCVVGDRLGIEWDTASGTNYILCSFSLTGSAEGSYESQYESGSWVNFTDRDLSADLYQGA